MADADRTSRGRSRRTVAQSAHAAAGCGAPRINDLEDSHRMIARRVILKSALAWAAAQMTFADRSAAAQASPPAGTAATANGPSQPFDFAWLKGQAHYLANNPYQESKDVLPPSMAKLG